MTIECDVSLAPREVAIVAAILHHGAELEGAKIRRLRELARGGLPLPSPESVILTEELASRRLDAALEVTRTASLPAPLVEDVIVLADLFRATGLPRIEEAAVVELADQLRSPHRNPGRAPRPSDNYHREPHNRWEY